ncbi:hypothetical protein NDU88_003165 [Pleurodeles waltl]|uniref:Uncharacterized protein n=1 Tax=Pleurodeles waltl TaxID=8319 RepID=A0AAV7QC67_PLEWA|nr:hypothetical protein NDU88_003165 [Pleurodeles waltl]
MQQVGMSRHSLTWLLGPSSRARVDAGSGPEQNMPLHHVAFSLFARCCCWRYSWLPNRIYASTKSPEAIKKQNIGEGEGKEKYQ